MILGGHIVNLSKLKVFFYLNIRIILMVFLQIITFIILFKKDNAFERSGYFWATHLSLVNLILLVLMIVIFKKRGRNYFSFFTEINKKNFIYFLKLLLPIVVVAMLPNLLLAYLFYGDLQMGAKFLLGDIPLFFFIINLTIFPILQGLVELPFYFLFIMPKLKSMSNHKWIYIGLPVFFLSIQHAFMPLRFDLLYMVYRSLMFFPFALVIGLIIHKKPKVMPYFVILHILMNASLFIMHFI